MTARAWVLPVLVMFAAGVAGCGERPQVTVYRHGEYQGKPDDLPWQSAPFNGSRDHWEKTVDGRTQSQNEYLRIQ